MIRLVFLLRRKQGMSLEDFQDEIEDLANSGKIPATRTGDSWKFERAQIDHWAASGRVK